MIITATQRNTRQTARKVRLVANSVRKLSLVDAINQLAHIERKSTLVVLKVLRQAIANAVHNHGFSVSELTIKNITVAPGPQFKRFRAVSRGRAHTVVKRSCHITVELEAEATKKAEVAKAEAVTKQKATVKKEVAKMKRTVKKTSVRKATAKAKEVMPKPKKVAKKEK